MHGNRILLDRFIHKNFENGQAYLKIYLRKLSTKTGKLEQ